MALTALVGAEASHEVARSLIVLRSLSDCADATATRVCTAVRTAPAFFARPAQLSIHVSILVAPQAVLNRDAT